MKLFLVLLSITCVFGYKSYSGYQVLETSVLDEGAARALVPLLGTPEYDFWVPPVVGRSARIMTSPDKIVELQQHLTHVGVSHHVCISDVQAMVEKERAEIDRVKAATRSGRAPPLDRFLQYDEIQAYLDEVAVTYPNIASLTTIGSSYENRTMRVLKLSNGPGKAGIFFDAAIHAREWIGPPVALFIINELTENLAVNQAMLDKNDFYFLPVANPDGYQYTWTDDRFWRKTRSNNPGSVCVGTDGNRNFDFYWGQGGEGPCSNTYAGSAPFSEVEVKAMADFIVANPSITFYTALHSAAQLFLTPWSWTTDLPADYNEMYRVGTEAADALFAVRGTRYQVGSSANLLYYSYGNSKDWAYGAVNITLSFTIELPEGGSGSFDPPPEDIIPVATETWEAIKVFAANIPATRH